jgi:hemolysin-activating ACP:hemolysin acyltransferase
MPPEAYLALGQMMILSGQTELYGSASLLSLLETYLPALRAGCVSFCTDGDKPTAFFIHTFVTEEIHQKMVADPLFVPPVEEWDARGEGKNIMWVMDAVSTQSKGSKALLRAVRKSLPAKTRVFRRKYRGRTVNPDLLETVIRHG